MSKTHVFDRFSILFLRNHGFGSMVPLRKLRNHGYENHDSTKGCGITVAINGPAREIAESRLYKPRFDKSHGITFLQNMVPQKPGGGCPAPVHGWSRLGLLHDPRESRSGSCPLQQCRTQKGVHRSSQMGVNLSGVDPRQIHGHFWSSPAPKKESREAPKWP